MAINRFLHYFKCVLILFLNHITVSHAGIGAISAAAAGGAMSVLKGKGRYGPRPRDETTEAVIMWTLMGGVGVILIAGSVTAVYKIIKSYREKNMEDLEEAKEGVYITSFQPDELKCELGILFTNKMSNQISYP